MSRTISRRRNQINIRVSKEITDDNINDEEHILEAASSTQSSSETCEWLSLPPSPWNDDGDDGDDYDGNNAERGAKNLDLFPQASSLTALAYYNTTHTTSRWSADAYDHSRENTCRYEGCKNAPYGRRATLCVAHKNKRRVPKSRLAMCTLEKMTVQCDVSEIEALKTRATRLCITCQVRLGRSRGLCDPCRFNADTTG